MQAGCSIKTDCEVKYVVKNPNDTNTHRKRARRWLVYLNETDYLQSDFVILSGNKQEINYEQMKCFYAY